MKPIEIDKQNKLYPIYADASRRIKAVERAMERFVKEIAKEFAQIDEVLEEWWELVYAAYPVLADEAETNLGATLDPRKKAIIIHTPGTHRKYPAIDIARNNRAARTAMKIEEQE